MYPHVLRFTCKNVRKYNLDWEEESTELRIKTCRRRKKQNWKTGFKVINVHIRSLIIILNV